MNVLRLIRPGRKKLLFIFLILLLAAILLIPEPNRPIQVAVAKGGRYMNSLAFLDAAADQALARDLALSDEAVSDTLANRDYGFLYAIPLGKAESSSWQDQGCTETGCVQVTFYDYTEGGTFEAVVNMSNGDVIDSWPNSDALPGASPYVVPRALEIVANDPEVFSLLGDVREADQLMVPMSVWLSDDDCQTDWCVDLTFLDPGGSGRVLHTVVNMEKETVARVFLTRGRPERLFKQPASQGANFNNGCHEASGWNVCWEMTANDGINFYDASFDGDPVFSSAKIGQIEVYYPSWPGGYRDEIGYSASVPPYFGTDVVDLDDGFEVRQLYTEFLRWPNCVCCYRYEQIIRFYDDGSFEPRFISHGPGCDDLSTYRPFWRIDMDIGDNEVDETWYWEDAKWQKAETELQLPLFSDLSPDGLKLFTASENQGYQWLPVATDPLNQDAGRLYVLRRNEGEGDGPIATGIALSYWPPGNWLDDERLDGEDLAVWYIPILKTKQGDPWWCMPDPEPDFSPCEAILRIEPATELKHPSPDQLPPTPTAAPLRPSPTPIAAPTFTPRPIAGEDAEMIILNSGCGSCHAIGKLGEAGKVGPDLSNIGLIAAERIATLSAADYLRQSIIDPQAFITPECPNSPCLENIMPGDYAQRLTDSQIDILVTFLLEQAIPPTPFPTTTVVSPLRATSIAAAPTPIPNPTSTPPVSTTTRNIDYLPAIILAVVIIATLALIILMRILSRKG